MRQKKKPQIQIAVGDEILACLLAKVDRIFINLCVVYAEREK